ncbi:MAG: DNA primase [Halobacteriota archaeon]
MIQLHARYPFFDAARDAVRAIDAELGALVAANDPAVDRAHERVKRALLEGTTASETPEEWTPQQELLSYPIARILVSLLDSAPAIEKYATAEAATAIDRLAEDRKTDDEFKSTETVRLDRDDFLGELDLSSAVTSEPIAGPREPEWFRVAVGPYLQYSASSWRDSWRLVNRELVDGAVRVERSELDRLLREAIARRVASGLPFEGLSKTDPIATALSEQLEDLNRLLSQRTAVGEIDFVARDLFPPCIENLLQKAEADTALRPFESFSLMAFLTGIGMDADEIIAFCAESSLDPEGIRYQTEYLRDDRGTQYPPPSCETLSAYGLCHNEDDHWKVASDPLTYYKRRLEATDEELVDWRETNA